MKLSIKNLFYIGVILAILTVIIYAFLPKPVDVDLAFVIRGPLRITIDEDGKTRIKERYVVSAPLAGQLLRVEIHAGDRVQAGKTLLARIRPSPAALLDERTRTEGIARVKAAEAALKQISPQLGRAQAELKLAESEKERAEKLFQNGVISRQELDRALTLFRTRLEEFKSAKFAEEIARFELEQARAALLQPTPQMDGQDEDRMRFDIYSPIDGRLLRVFQESAAVVAPGTPLMELGDPNDLELVVDVLSSDAVKIRPGNRVIIERWGGEYSLQGVVRLVEPSAFTKISALGVEEQRVNVIIDFVDSPENRAALGDGYRVEAHIVIWEREDVLKVPVSALFRNGPDWATFLVVEGRAKLKPVKIGQWGSLEAEVLDGLNLNDQVIVYPSDKIKDGVAVTPRKGST
ncbi:MAG TPA: HlyD family efflux transporter periplasmic adaptor subunit [Candidatus Limnocylindrales bacterium]|nr:HlyD family efflux transporter periplasmic adaptor subunit [Candidatus Limnocylindrales bacterium]